MATSDVLLPQKSYKASLLTEELKAALPGVSDGVHTDKVDGVLRMFAVLINPQSGDATTAVNVANAHNAVTLTANETLRENIKTTAQSAVGVAYDALTAAQVRALFAIVLWKEGALNNDGTVKPLGQWVR